MGRLGVRAGLSAFPSPPWIFLLPILLCFISPSSSSPAGIPYADHCNSIVPKATPTGLLVDSPTSFQLLDGYFSGGGPLLSLDRRSIPSSLDSFNFQVKSLHRTETPGVLQVDGTLVFNSWAKNSYFHRYRNFNSYFHHQRNFTTTREATFELSGFWSNSTGKLCMVGRGLVQPHREGTFIDLSAVLKLNYPEQSNISTSVVNGTVESLDAALSPSHFDPVSILAYAQKNYEYTMISQANESCSHIKIEGESVEFGPGTVCSNLLNLLYDVPFVLDTGSSCSNGNCDLLGRGDRFSPSFMFLNLIQCSDDEKLHFYIDFSNDSMHDNYRTIMPNKSLVGEGFWNASENRLCLIACRILDASGNSLAYGSVGDCTIGLSLWFPAVWSISNQSSAIGRIWSRKNKNDAGYFSMVSFRSSRDGLVSIPGLKYEYTKLDAVKNFCPMNDFSKLGKRSYPDGRSFYDMTFSISVNVLRGIHAWGQATPVFIGETYNAKYGSVRTISEINHTLWNVSYKLTYDFWNLSSSVYESTVIRAEGIYNAETGKLCMVGCQYSISSVARKQANGEDSNSTDCEILIDVQLRPLDPQAGDTSNGKISSLRKKSDPHFFGPLEITAFSMYGTQAAEITWLLDIEIIMVLISLTLSCIFIIVQIYHVNRHPHVLPSISITMLVILALGYMVPLFLNFEALFVRHNRHDILLRSGGWLELNEVIVRVMTMVAFLLQFRLLQVAWSSRSAEDGRKGLSSPERTALKLCLPLYFAGGLIACLVHATPRRTTYYAAENQRHSMWEDLIMSYSGNLISYGGLILDAFLLPQIILNIFGSSKEKVLTPFFYVGTTVVRALPHLYDAYRAHRHLPQFNSSYVYARPDEDFYSSAWDTIIPCGGLLFAVLIFLQQRYGGGCILPARFGKPEYRYQAVSMAGL